MNNTATEIARDITIALIHGTGGNKDLAAATKQAAEAYRAIYDEVKAAQGRGTGPTAPSS